MAGYAVIAAIDEGHFISTSKGGICRACGEPMPCRVIEAARAISVRIDSQWKRPEVPK